MWPHWFHRSFRVKKPFILIPSGINVYRTMEITSLKAKSTINGQFSIAILNYQKVLWACSCLPRAGHWVCHFPKAINLPAAMKISIRRWSCSVWVAGDGCGGATVDVYQTILVASTCTRSMLVDWTWCIWPTTNLLYVGWTVAKFGQIWHWQWK